MKINLFESFLVFGAAILPSTDRKAILAMLVELLVEFGLTETERYAEAVRELSALS